MTVLPKLPAEIAADFIRQIYEHALLEISKTVPAGYMELCTKKFVVTGKWKCQQPYTYSF